MIIFVFSIYNGISNHDSTAQIFNRTYVVIVMPEWKICDIFFTVRGFLLCRFFFFPCSGVVFNHIVHCLCHQSFFLCTFHCNPQCSDNLLKVALEMSKKCPRQMSKILERIISLETDLPGYPSFCVQWYHLETLLNVILQF